MSTNATNRVGDKGGRRSKRGRKIEELNWNGIWIKTETDIRIGFQQIFLQFYFQILVVIVLVFTNNT